MEKDGFIYLLIDGTNDMDIDAAINKHGVENFVIVILKVCHSKKERDYWERHFIKYRNSLAPNGYNCTTGGEYDFRKSPESCARMSASIVGSF